MLRLEPRLGVGQVLLREAGLRRLPNDLHPLVVLGPIPERQGHGISEVRIVGGHLEEIEE